MSYHIDSHLELHRLSHHDRCRDVKNWHMAKEAKAGPRRKRILFSRLMKAAGSFKNDVEGKLSETQTRIELQTR